MSKELVALKDRIVRNLNWQGVRKLFRILLRPIAEPLSDTAAAYRLKHLTKEPSDDGRPVRVAFLLQAPELWDKLERVYEEMRGDERFDPVLVALPDPSVNNWGDMRVEDMSHDAEEFCKRRYTCEDVLFAVHQDGSLEDFSKLGFEYVFYQRPYDAKLPRKYRSASVSRWARVCYVPYGYTLSPFAEQMTVNNRSYFRNATLVFSEDEHMRTLMLRRWDGRAGNEFRHIEALGYPALERYAHASRRNGPVRRVLWTPRWSTNPTIGGSHFMDYKDDVLSLPDCGFEVRLRPHQLMWDELDKCGLMSRKEQDCYRSRALDLGCDFSSSKDCLADFEWSDVIVSDYSSITIEYLLTGRPMIYCPPPYEVNATMRDLLQGGAYIANSWGDVLQYLGMLQSGKDPKREMREEVVSGILGDVRGSAHRIALRVLEDHMGRMPHVPTENSKATL